MKNPLTKEILRAMADIMTQERDLHRYNQTGCFKRGGIDLEVVDAGEMYSMLEDAMDTALERMDAASAEENAADLKMRGEREEQG